MKIFMETNLFSSVVEGCKGINVKVMWLQAKLVWEIFRSKATQAYMQWFKYTYSLIVGESDFM